MKRSLLMQAAVLALVACLFSSCATIFGKSSYPFTVTTNPAGADVTITNKKGKEIFKGKSPASVTLKSGAGYFSRAEYQVKLNSPGFQEQILPVNFKMNGWYFGNLLIGGILGMLVIDPISGAMWKLETKEINTSMTPSNSSAVNTPTLKIINIADVPENVKKDLVKIK